MPNHINLEDIALAQNPNAMTCQMVTEGLTFDALKAVTAALWPLINQMDHSQRPAEPAKGEPGDRWCTPAHEPKPLTYDQKNLITAYVLARETYIVAAVNHPNFSHARSHGGGPTMGWTTYLYHHDRKSPSGVICVGGGEADRVDPIVRKLRSTSPLSPTEGLRSGR